MVFAGALLAASLGTASAAAEPMDPALERLVLDPSCRTPNGEFTPITNASGMVNGRGGACSPDDDAFLKLVNQYAFAIAPSAMYSARTTGFGGLDFGFEAQFTHVDSDSDYLKSGTQGPKDPSTGNASVTNNGPDSLLQLYSVKIRKGFGFGFEVATQFGFMPNTSILTGGADARLALLEGFRSGFLGILPDVAVGGGVRTITGTSEFQLTVASMDAQLSKPITIEDASVLTPWVGYQYLWIFGDSGVIDLTPATDALQYCNYVGNNVPGGPVDPNQPDRDGQPVCDNGSEADFNNNVVFDPVRLQRQRFIVGANYRYEIVSVGAQFMMDFVPPADAQTDDDDADVLDGEEKQWAFAFDLVAVF